MTTFKKTTPTCSNIYLLDDTLCLSNTLGTINYNVSSLSIAISDVTRYNTSWSNLYTIFTTYSSKWIKTATNIQAFSAVWLNTATTVSTLSSRWNKLYTLYYPKMIDINDWISLGTTAQNKAFSFRFNRSFYEPCTPTGGGLSISCNGCSRPSRGCNHHGGRAGWGPCTNAYDGCSVSRTAGAVSVSCTGSGAKNLSIGLVRNASDRNTARTVKVSFKNINRNWTAI